MRKLWLVVPFFIAGGLLLGDRLLARKTVIPTAAARRGELLLSVDLTGSVDAKRAYTITAPRIRNLQITWMAPEGSQVKAGDPVIRFDSTQQQAEVADGESALKIAQTALDRARQEYTIQEKQLQLELQRARRNYDEKKHDAPKIEQEAKLELDVAELNIKAKLDQIESDVQKSELEVQRARDKVAETRRDLGQMSLNAPIPGMVVYLEIWKGSSTGKVQEGDSPWPGQGLINLPDLSEMVVKATVSEVDASKITPGQEAIVTLDAVPEVHYKGVVRSKGALARRKDDNSKINVFDVEIAIEDKDEALKPGMSASVQVVMERLEDVVSVPLEAVFEKDGKPVVYLAAGKRPRSVELGKRTDMDVQVISGLSAGEVVCLIDPSRPALPGEPATEPELNRGRIEVPPAAAPAPVKGS